MRTAVALALAAMAFYAFAAPSAQAAYPERPVIAMVAFAAGGPTDVLARGIQEAIGRGREQQVVVKNVPGAAGSIGEILERRKYSISYQDAAAFKASVEADDKRMGELIKAAGLA